MIASTDSQLLWIQVSVLIVAFFVILQTPPIAFMIFFILLRYVTILAISES